MATTTPDPVFGTQPSPAEIAARVAGYGAWLEIDLDAIGRNLDAAAETPRARAPT